MKYNLALKYTREDHTRTVYQLARLIYISTLKSFCYLGFEFELLQCLNPAEIGLNYWFQIYMSLTPSLFVFSFLKKKKKKKKSKLKTKHTKLLSSLYYIKTFFQKIKIKTTF